MIKVLSVNGKIPLVDGKAIKALDNIAMRVEGGYIQYSTDDGKTWVNLIAEADLKGDKGDKGADGTDGITPHIGDNGNWYLGATDTGKPSRGAAGSAGQAGKNGKSAYQYAQEGGYTGTEAEFTAKLAAEKFANPNALTFTGAVTGSYDGSESLTVDIPSGGGSISLPLLYDLTTSEEVGWIDTGDNAFLAKNLLFVELTSIATTTNESDNDGSASMYPLTPDTLQAPWSNEAVAGRVSNLMAKTYTKVFRAFSFRGDGGYWTSVTSIRNYVNTKYVTPSMVSSQIEGVTDQPIRGLIIGNAFASSTNVFGVGSRLRVWGV